MDVEEMIGKYFNKVCKRLGATRDPTPFTNELLHRYREPHRRYHTLQHIAHGLHAFDTMVVQNGSAPVSANTDFLLDGVRYSFCCHDVIYSTDRHDNEERSAEWAVDHLHCLGISFGDKRVYRNILATRHTKPPETLSEMLTVDLDLLILGETPELFWRYDRQIREEYSFVPEAIYCAKRAEILQGFLDRPRIYTPLPCFSLYEERAHKNLREAIERLSRCPSSTPATRRGRTRRRSQR